MGNFFNKAKDTIQSVGNKIDDKANEFAANREGERKRFNRHLMDKSQENMPDDMYEGIDDDYEDDEERGDRDRGISDDYDIGIQPTQKPESFFHFILENQYKDLERSIRGFKDIFNKTLQKWETKRKDTHCFTDEEAEDILRTAQSHLSTDIKLSYIHKEVFGQMMMAIYKQIDNLFYSISEYRYGRYKNTEEQYNMKLQNRKIFLELWTRIQANYSRAIQGSENKSTHGSVKGQESLQSSDRMDDRNGFGGQY